MLAIAGSSFLDQILPIHDQVMKIANGEMMRGLAFLICVAGLILQVRRFRAGDNRIWEPIVTLAFIVAAIAFLPQIFQFTKNLTWEIATTISSTYANAPFEYLAKIQQQLTDNMVGLTGGSGASFSILDFGMNMAAALFAIIWVALALVAITIAIVLYLGMHVLQYFLELMCYMFLPAFIALIAIPETKPIGIKYLQTLVGIMIWPIGFAVVHLVSANLLQAIAVFATATAGPQSLGLGAMIISGWVILASLTVPFLCDGLISRGAPMTGSVTGPPAMAGTVAITTLPAVGLGLATGGGAASVGASGAGAGASGLSGATQASGQTAGTNPTAAPARSDSVPVVSTARGETAPSDIFPAGGRAEAAAADNADSSTTGTSESSSSESGGQATSASGATSFTGSTGQRPQNPSAQPQAQATQSGGPSMNLLGALSAQVAPAGPDTGAQNFGAPAAAGLTAAGGSSTGSAKLAGATSLATTGAKPAASALNLGNYDDGSNAVRQARFEETSNLETPEILSPDQYDDDLGDIADAI